MSVMTPAGVAEAWVLSVGIFLVTITCSAGSPQVVAAGALLASPL